MQASTNTTERDRISRQRLAVQESRHALVSLLPEVPVDERELAEILLAESFHLLAERDLPDLYDLRDAVANYCDACGFGWYGMGSTDGNAFAIIKQVRTSLFDVVRKARLKYTGLDFDPYVEVEDF